MLNDTNNQKGRNKTCEVEFLKHIAHLSLIIVRKKISKN